jgi:hypothetical protein
MARTLVERPDATPVDEADLGPIIRDLKAHVASIQTAKQSTCDGAVLLAAINDLPRVVRRLEAAEFAIDAAFEAHEDAPSAASRIEELERALRVADHDLTTTHNLRATDLSPDQMNEALNRGIALADLEWMTDNSRGLDAIRQALSDPTPVTHTVKQLGAARFLYTETGEG